LTRVEHAGALEGNKHQAEDSRVVLDKGGVLLQPDSSHPGRRDPGHALHRGVVVPRLVLLHELHRDRAGAPGDLQPASALGKVFSSVLAFVSVGTVITALIFLFGPFFGRLLKAGEEKLEDVEHEVKELEHRQGA
jgi:hypothetical protein